MILEPYWWQAAPRPKTEPPPFPSPAKADVAIVGSGITGLVAAMGLARGGRSVVVFEAEEPGIGASSRNAGYVGRTFKYTFGELVERQGLDYAKALYKELRTAFEAVSKLIATERIDCGFAMQGRYIMAASPSQRESLTREFDLRAKHLGDSYTPVSRADQHREIATDLYHGGVVIADMAGLHPGLYHQGLLDRALAAGVTVLPFTPVHALRREGDAFEIATPRGRLAAKDVIVATNGYSGPAFPWLQRRVVPFDAYMIATEPLPASVLDAVMPGKRTFIDWNFDVDFIRRSPDDSRIVFGGNTGVIGADLTRMGEALRQKLRRVLPQLGDVELAHSWTGRCAGTRDLYPHIGVEDGIHYAVGYCFAGVP
ncbi:MAG: FAD-binding oxidoreductase, partial [Rhizobiales bacterium]|nr:FAD-binding oxidoreductase [Hyphomicrobiales bacterium]